MNFTRTETTTIDYFYAYMFDLELPYSITNLDLSNRDGTSYIHIVADRELTLTEQSALNQKIQEYSDFSQSVINENILDLCKKWGRDTINRFELRNMRRKDAGDMARRELDHIISETHDTGVFICLLEGSLDSLHGKLHGYPEQVVNGVTWAAEAPKTFTYVWEEDITWLKAELNTFLGSL